MEQILVGRKDAARLLGISARHLITLEQTGQLPKPKQLGRRKLFSVVELEKWATDCYAEQQPEHIGSIVDRVMTQIEQRMSRNNSFDRDKNREK